MYCKPCKSRGVLTEVTAPRLKRTDGGQFLCEDCAETVARKRKWTVVSLHKQGYSAFSREAARDVVRQLNPKRGGL